MLVIPKEPLAYEQYAQVKRDEELHMEALELKRKMAREAKVKNKLRDRMREWKKETGIVIDKGFKRGKSQ